jgi:hypothetical protein
MFISLIDLCELTALLAKKANLFMAELSMDYGRIVIVINQFKM